MHVVYRKKGKEVQEKGTIMIFPLIFANLGHLECYTHSKWYVVLKVLTENMVMYFSKRALRADTTLNKWLKIALLGFYQNFLTDSFQG